MNISKEEAIIQAQSKEAQQLLNEHRKQAVTNTPVLAKAHDLIYKAYKRPYLNSGNDILVIVANGWYFPTPQVDLYIESSAGNYKLMQKTSNAGFDLATYYTAQWTSGLDLETTPDTIKIEDATGTHTINVESY